VKEQIEAMLAKAEIEESTLHVEVESLRSRLFAAEQEFLRAQKGHDKAKLVARRLREALDAMEGEA
jgi:hypothetical protein